MYNGVRYILINGLNREKLIDFIKRKDKFYKETDFENFSDGQLRELAVFIDKKVQANR